MYSVTSDIFSEKILHYKLFSPQKLFSPCSVCFNLQRMESQREGDLTVPGAMLSKYSPGAEEI